MSIRREQSKFREMMKERNIIIVLVLATVITLSSCKNMICVDGNGIAGVETREPGIFTGIINTTDADVVYHTSNEFLVEVETDENIIPYYKTEISGNNLEIVTRGADCLRPVRKPVINVYAPGISEFGSTGSGEMTADTVSGTETYIFNSGSGNIFIDYCQAIIIEVVISGSGNISMYNSASNEMSFKISGSGDINATGDSDIGHFTSSGSGTINSFNLFLNIGNISISGSGDVYSTIYNELFASLSGSGNLYLKGDPAINKSISGSGRIVESK